MQSLILAVQNAVDPRDLGAGTSAATFFRSLAGSFGVAILGAVLSTRLTSELGQRLPAAMTQLTPDQAAQVEASGGASNFSINQPSVILALPEPLRNAVQTSFVEALHIVFLITGLIALVAVAVSLALPDKELRGAAPATDEDAAADTEARTQAMI